jgi:hypothetical protein
VDLALPRDLDLPVGVPELDLHEVKASAAARRRALVSADRDVARLDGDEVSR